LGEPRLYSGWSQPFASNCLRRLQCGEPPLTPRNETLQMATAHKGPNKSAFLRDLFKKNPTLKEAEVNEAWQKAGNEGEIGLTLYYNVKREFGGEAEVAAKIPEKAGSKASPKGPKGERAGLQTKESSRESSGKPATKPATKTVVNKSGAGDREQVLGRVEDEIDDLIGELKELGGMEEGLEALKKLRRVVVRSHEG
jgi:hypothetical protein